ncbi:hypothetical protein NEF87_000193 [Candidatus Lokiarchaeum ossiferum]|uniref:Apea-like HEPN domain-containing protein n=1 Tax=Candidatus Lokiarchaeum ossiferum TaxID=2951803 RepID=A0ABY6HKS4_9ARCH|nr:hypothetical protein NEF87_000193 [Candidatus Lokiarchaeum sp. B-35]
MLNRILVKIRGIHLNFPIKIELDAFEKFILAPEENIRMKSYYDSHPVSENVLDRFKMDVNSNIWLYLDVDLPEEIKIIDEVYALLSPFTELCLLLMNYRIQITNCFHFNSRNNVVRILESYPSQIEFYKPYARIPYLIGTPQLFRFCISQLWNLFFQNNDYSSRLRILIQSFNQNTIDQSIGLGWLSLEHITSTYFKNKQQNTLISEKKLEKLKKKIHRYLKKNLKTNNKGLVKIQEITKAIRSNIKNWEKKKLITISKEKKNKLTEKVERMIRTQDIIYKEYSPRKISEIICKELWKFPRIKDQIKLMCSELDEINYDEELIDFMHSTRNNLFHKGLSIDEIIKGSRKLHDVQDIINKYTEFKEWLLKLYFKLIHLDDFFDMDKYGRLSLNKEKNEEYNHSIRAFISAPYQYIRDSFPLFPPNLLAKISISTIDFDKDYEGKIIIGLKEFSISLKFLGTQFAFSISMMTSIIPTKTELSQFTGKIIIIIQDMDWEITLKKSSAFKIYNQNIYHGSCLEIEINKN